MTHPDHDACLAITVKILGECKLSIFFSLFLQLVLPFSSVFYIADMGLEVLGYKLVWCTWLEFRKDLFCT